MPQAYDDYEFEKLLADAPANYMTILAEGDSWFAYPRSHIIAGPPANIIDHLAKEDTAIIYNSAGNGDEAVTMLSGEQKLELIKRIKHTHFDYLLFSGGGNDIVGIYDFDFLIKPMGDHGDWRKCLRKVRIKAKVRQIESAYRMLCELVIDHSKNKDIKVISHTYDKLTPQKHGFHLFDVIPLGTSWLYPYLVQKNIKKPSDQKAIVAYILTEFSAALKRVEAQYDFFVLANTYGTLTKDEWRDEIHPTSAGFEKLARKIRSKMKKPIRPAPNGTADTDGINVQP